MGPAIDPAIIATLLLQSPGVAAALVVGIVIALAVAGPAGRRMRRPAALVALTVASVGGIMAVTMLPAVQWSLLMQTSSGQLGLSLARCAGDWGGVWYQLSHGWDAPMNIALYVPAGACLTWLTHRPVRAVLALSAMSLTIELYQVVIDRSCQASDWIANSLGACIGACLGAVSAAVTAAVMAASAHRRAARPIPPSA